MTDVKTNTKDNSPAKSNNQAENSKKAAKTTKAIKNGAARNGRNRSPISQPTITRKATVNTASAQNLMDRQFERLEMALFVLDVPLLFSKNINTVEKYQIATDEAYDNLRNELKTALESANQLAVNHDISQDVVYANAKEYTFTIRTPRAMAFLNLILLFDKLIVCVDNLWMNDADLVGGNRNRMEHHQLWERRLVRFFQEIIRFQIDFYRNRNEVSENVESPSAKEDKPESISNGHDVSSEVSPEQLESNKSQESEQVTA